MTKPWERDDDYWRDRPPLDDPEPFEKPFELELSFDLRLIGGSKTIPDMSAPRPVRGSLSGRTFHGHLPKRFTRREAAAELRKMRAAGYRGHAWPWSGEIVL